MKKVCMRVSRLSSARAAQGDQPKMLFYVTYSFSSFTRRSSMGGASMGHKIIVIRALRTPAARKAFTYFFLALDGVKHPGPRLPGGLVPQVLGMATRQYCNPVTVFILAKAKQGRVFQSGPSVRVAFAFGRLLG
jgi:hypothetical protein